MINQESLCKTKLRLLQLRAKIKKYDWLGLRFDFLIMNDKNQDTYRVTM